MEQLFVRILCHRAYVPEQGRVVMSGTGTELLGSPHAKSAYLGIGEPTEDLFSRGSQP